MRSKDNTGIFSSDVYGILYKNYPNQLFVLNVRGNIIYANPTAVKLFSSTNGDPINMDFNQIISPTDIDSFYYYFQKAVDGETNSLTLLVFCKKDKDTEVDVTLVPNEYEGKVVSVSVYIKNIKKHREANIIKKGLSESFIENNRDPILLLDMNATVVLVNRAFSQLLGWRKENLEGCHIFKCPSIPTHLLDQMKEYYHRVVTPQASSGLTSDSDISTLETIRVTNDEKAYHVMISITPVHDFHGNICNWAVHLRDITLQKKAEKALVRSENLLAIGQIAAGVTHEIRNPLQSVKGLTQLLKSSRDEIVENNHYLDVMMSELKQIESFVNDISLLARTKQKSYKMAVIPLLIKDAIDLLNTEAILNNVIIKFDYDQVNEFWCDEDLLRHALFNVIKNGIESMENGGLLNVVIKSFSDRIKISVIDHGVGIPEERILKLGELSYENNEKGFGLGLLLTFKIIEQHQGEITVNSEVGKGTKVIISLPVVMKEC